MPTSGIAPYIFGKALFDDFLGVRESKKMQATEPSWLGSQRG
jgi:hypothetical protein